MIISLPYIIRLFYQLLLDRRVKFHLKLVLVAAIVYALSPVDILPDFLIPGIGYLDDLVIVYFAMKYFINRIPSAIIDEHINRIQPGRSSYK